MKIKNKLILLYALLFFACSNEFYNKKFNKNQNYIKVQNIKSDNKISSLIEPYDKIIYQYMKDTLCYSKYDLTKNVPESTIGNFVTDLCLHYADADICIMNKGGLRTEIYQGYVTREKIYELMPFENELVILEINKETFKLLIDYIINRSGEPFSGMNIKSFKNETKVHINDTIHIDNYFANSTKIKILTSDYLANGGDNMNFFKKIEKKKLNLKLRDVIIDYCSQIDTIKVTLDERIILNHE